MIIAAALVIAGFAAWSVWYPINERASLYGKSKSVLLVKYNLWGSALSAMSKDEDTGTLLYGPLSDSGAMHGKWTAVSRKQEVSTVWYWFGTQVTEGEWHKNAR